MDPNVPSNKRIVLITGAKSGLGSFIMPDADFSKWVQPKDVAELVLWLFDMRARHISSVAVPIEGQGV